MDESALPSDRSNRHKWRKKIGGGIKIDNSIPDLDADKKSAIEKLKGLGLTEKEIKSL